MNRRLAGIVTLVLALVAVMVVPSIGGIRTPGSAVASIFPAPPQVGDCLSAPVPKATRLGLPPEISVTAATFGRCDGLIGGEIVALWPTVAAAEAAGATRPGFRGPCYWQVAEYTGLQTQSRSIDPFGVPIDDSIIWRPTIGFEPFHVVPGKRESNAGRSWVACLAVTAGGSAYEGTLRAAFTTGSMPDQFGSCWPGTDLDRIPRPLSCDQPHPAELLANGFIRNGVDVPAKTINQSCTDIARRIMRVDDPTQGGRLSIVADRVTGEGLSPPGRISLGCLVTATAPQLLSGTVIGLADRPLPFAS